MSKIIVDQIAKNGGATLTIPAADGSVNQPVVTNGAGVLSFGAVGMPTADSTANKPVVTNGSGQLGFGVVAIPTADGTAGQLVKTDGAGQLSFTAPPVNTVVPNDHEDIIGSVISNSARQNVYSTGDWSSSGPWTTYYHSWQDANSKTQGFNMFMGDGYPDGTSQLMYVNDGSSNAMNRVKEYSHGTRMGNFYKDYYYYDNVTSNYSGVSWRCTPIRNTTNTSITRTFIQYVSGADTNYGGTGIVTYTPNTSVYSTTTAGTWQDLFTSGSNSVSMSRSVGVVVPANTTVLLFTNSIHKYETTYRFKDTNMLYNLHTSFGTGLVCDLRMLETLATANIGSESTQTTAHPEKLYPACAALYGDR